MDHKKKDTQLLTTLSVAIICLLLSLYFPATSPFEKITCSIFFLFVLPALYIKIVLKKRISDFGFNLKNKTFGIFGGIITLGLIILYVYLGQKYAFLRADFEIPPLAAVNFFWFVFYELILVGANLFCFEFFFRGFLLFSLAEKFSIWSIPFQALLYTLSGFFTGADLPTFFQLAFLGIILGILSFRTRSFVYSYGIMLVASIMIDAWLIHTLK